MSADDNLCQQLQSTYRRINIERIENEVDAEALCRAMIFYDFKVGINTSTSTNSIWN